MTESLHPMNLGSILDRGVQIFRAQYQLFFGVAVIPRLAQLASQLAAVHLKSVLPRTAAEGGLVFARYGASFVFSVAHLVLLAIAQAAICLAASRVSLCEGITVRSAFGAFTSKAGRLVGLSFLQGIYAGWPLIIVVIITSVLSVGAMQSPTSIYWLAPVWILGAIPCIALFIRYALAFPATAIEGLTAQAAIQRSVGLGEGGRWRICWGVLVPSVPPFVLATASTALIAHFKASSPLLAGGPIAVAGINGVVELIAALVFTPYSAIILTLLYYDQRIRHEGFDIERMMDAAGLNPPAPLELADAPAPTQADGPTPPAAEEGYA